jgi:hypothetical protein
LIYIKKREQIQKRLASNSGHRKIQIRPLSLETSQHPIPVMGRQIQPVRDSNPATGMETGQRHPASTP